MNYVVDTGPYIKDSDSTSKIMRRVFIALLPIILFAIYKNGVLPYQKGYIDLLTACKPLFIILIAIVTSILSEILYVRFVLKRKGMELSSYIKHSYAVLPGLFLALITPINAPLWLVSLSSAFATIVGKMLFGGFGHNIFNPALIGSLFMTTSYGALIASHGGVFNGMELDTITHATPLSHLHTIGFVGDWTSIGSSFGSLWNFLFGFIPGYLGETSKILILIAMIYLIFAKVIKWRIPTIYLLTVFIMTSIIGYMNNMGIWYALFHLLSGGLMFGAVFMATDPVTSPITKNGQFLYAICLGILTVVFRFLTSYPEGVLTSILTMNMLVFVIDKIGAKTKLNPSKIIMPTTVLVLLVFGLSLYIGNIIKPETKPIDDRFTIINITNSNNATVYNVSSKGFHGPIKADITIKNDRITNINIISQIEDYWPEIENNDYINRLINEQDNIQNVDTLSGATASSTALKYMVTKVLEDYQNKK